MYFNHPSQGNSVNYYIILDPRDKAAPPTSQKVAKFPPTREKSRHGHPFLFLFLPRPQEISLCSLPIRGNVRRTGRIFPEHVEQSFLDRISWTRFESRSKSSPKNQLCVVSSPLSLRYFSCFGPHIWNSLPQDLRHCSTLSYFKAKLKTFLFSQYFHPN